MSGADTSDLCLSQLAPNVRLYDRRRNRERLVQAVERQGSIAYLSLRDPKTGEVERLPFVVSGLADCFDVLDAAGAAFGGDAALVCLVAEAHRLNHSYLFNPVFATETSLIDPLLHQFVAVYGLPPGDGHRSPHAAGDLLLLASAAPGSARYPG